MILFLKKSTEAKVYREVEQGKLIFFSKDFNVNLKPDLDVTGRKVCVFIV